jgi:LysR family transcriptional regulator for metE and metH
MGIAVMSEWMASGYVERAASALVVRRLASGPLKRPWRIAYRDEFAPVAERLKEELRASAPRLRAVG